MNVDSFDKPQRRAVLTDGNILVSASAGSGKTSVLTERYLRLIRDGVPTDRILVLTFSEKAAAEMRERIEKKLELYADGLDATEARRLLLGLERADISTIHGFLYKIVYGHFYELGIDPNFGMLSDGESDILKRRAFSAVFKRSDGAALKKSVERLSGERSDDGVYQAVAECWRLRSADGGGEVYNFDVSLNACLDYTVSYIREELERYLEIGAVVEKQCEGCPSIDILREIRDALSISLSAKSREELLKNVKNAEKSKVRLSNKERDPLKEKIAVYKTKFNEKLKELKATAEELPSLLAEANADRDTFLKFAELYSLFEKEYEAIKKEEGKLDFSDLERFSVRLFCDETILEEIRGGYDYILIDEYQDTNRIQERILNALSRGELFAVGDVKQSIYGFRLADPSIFIERRKAYAEGGGEICDLNNNYRTSARLTELINRIFKTVMTERDGGVDYFNDAMLIAGTDYAAETYRPYSLAFFERQKDNGLEDLSGIYDMQEDDSAADGTLLDHEEGLYIASAIKKLMTDCQIYIPKEKRYRAVEYGDIAVLTRSGKGSAVGIGEILRACEIPVSGGYRKTGKNYGGLAAELLELISNAKNDIAIAAVMLSPFGGFCDADLVRIRLNANDAEYMHEAVSLYAEGKTRNSQKNAALDGALIKKSRDFLDMLARLRQKAADSGVYALLCDIAYGRYGSDILGDDEQSILAAASEVRGLAELANILRTPELKKAESISLDSGSVLMSTVHASKGLEFPIVFLADCGHRFNEDFLRRRFDFDRTLGIAFYHGDGLTQRPSIFKKAIALKKKKELREEESRLLYVAMTRAKNHLFITGSGVTPDDDDFLYKSRRSFADFIRLAAFFDSDIRTEYIDGFKGEKSARRVTEGAGEVPELIDDVSRRAEELDRLINGKRTVSRAAPTKKSVTELAHEGLGLPREKRNDNFDEGLFFDRGIAYHKVMQYIEFGAATEGRVESCIAEMLKNGVLDPKEAELISPRDIARCLNCEIMLYAASNTTVREKEFMLKIKSGETEVLAQGVIDLMILGEKNIIIDYKTGKYDKQSESSYKRQLALYKQAAQGAGIRIDAAYLYWFRGNLLQSAD